ncbi:CAAX prenyl protease 2 isoform X2 [Daktulosphaira vitifoliae]|uniref:CAAX prenyl protease 2 isoform X2 n=1 Tax=Daktulosphaira vitifoliae TaxID=58002 RepID=UPI0021A98E38|nr:CAAX prenyl protease 2 isoform X2 [Daktulosphaira vitifoliae]
MEFSTTKIPIWQWLGFKWKGFFMSITSSILLTCILFLGPLCMNCIKNIQFKDVISLERIKSNFTDLIWLRNYIVAPISEEFTFRACIIPLLLQCFPPIATIFICPIFFGAAHFNQWLERMRAGISCHQAFIMSVFQFVYTTIFGAYSALLFISTGNLIAPILAHKFCNHMGFPDFREMFQLPEPKRSCLFIISLAGFILWCFLIVFCMEPWIYSNYIDWTEMNKCNKTNN